MDMDTKRDLKKAKKLLIRKAVKSKFILCFCKIQKRKFGINSVNFLKFLSSLYI